MVLPLANITVEAGTTTLSDGLSTGLCFLDRDEIAARVRSCAEVKAATPVSAAGDLVSL